MTPQRINHYHVDSQRGEMATITLDCLIRLSDELFNE